MRSTIGLNQQLQICSYSRVLTPSWFIKRSSVNLDKSLILIVNIELIQKTFHETSVCSENNFFFFFQMLTLSAFTIIKQIDKTAKSTSINKITCQGI